MKVQTAKEIQLKTILEAIENGSYDWTKGWVPVLNRGYASKTPYRGGNAVAVELYRRAMGYSSHIWLTFAKFVTLQKKDPRIRMRTGSRSYPVTLWKEVEDKDRDGNVVLDRNGNPLTHWAQFAYQVFNADCFENLDISRMEEMQYVLDGDSTRTAEDMEAMLLASYEGGPTVAHDACDRAYYSKCDDAVHLQNTRTFRTAAEYIGTLAHELGHSTGTEKRLARKSLESYSGDVGERSYEELVAELTACIVCGRLGIADRILDNSAAYMKGWLKPLGDNPTWFLDAYRDAEKAANLIYPAASGNMTDPESSPEAEAA